MNRGGIRGELLRKAAALLIVICFLSAPIPTMAENGGKYFKKGLKYESAEEWDLAAEQYALALNSNPANSEFKLHLIRALTKASLMFMERGKTLAEQKDYEGAYQSYRQAYSYDNTNELALTRMKEMLEKQGIPVEQSDLPQDEIKKASERVEQFNQLKPVVRKFKPKEKISFRDAPMSVIIRSLAEAEGLNVIFENTVTRQLETTKTNFELRNISAPRALEIFLTANRYSFAQVDRRTIIIFADALANRQRYDDLAMRTFYLKNVPMSEARGALQIAFAGKQLQVAELKQLNALMVRETPDNLKLVEAILNSIDKTQSEVVLDVNIYEVSNQAMQQIGNQFATPSDTGNASSVGNLGGLGQSGLRRRAPGGLFTPIFGAALTAPPTVLTLLQSKNDAKLVASTQIRAFEGKAATVNIGSRVPVQTATLPTSTVVTTGTQQNQNGQTNPNNTTTINPNSFGVAQFQYVDVGLNINITPTVLNDYVQMEMEIESTGLAAGPTALNPAFTQRRMKGVARIKESETGVVANVMRLDNSSGRSGLPVISFLPIIGRFFSTPTTKTDNTNVVITVTPHVLRAPEVGPEDRLAIGPNGTALGPGVNVSLEELITKAEREEEVLQRASLPAGSSQTQPSQTANNANSGVAKPAAVANNQNGGVSSIVQTSTQTPIQQPVQPVQQPIQPVQQPQPPPQQQPDQPQQQPDSAQQQQQAVSPVTVTVRVLNDNIRIGQGGLIGIITTSPNATLSGAIIGMRFNPGVIKVTSVRDGGLLSLLGAQAEFTHNDGGDSVSISIHRPVGAQAVNANGQLALIYFQGVGEGSADLAMTDLQLFGPDGQALPYTIVNGNIQVQGGQQGNPQPGSENDSDDDDE